MLKAEGLEGGVRGRRQGLGPLYRPAPAAMGHGARALAPWATALGILPLVATATGAWPHRTVLLTVGGSPIVVTHGGRNSERHGPRRQMYICRKFWFDHLFFENHDKLNIKKFFELGYPWFWSPTLEFLSSSRLILSNTKYGESDYFSDHST
jgi:hypothetical protein